MDLKFTIGKFCKRVDTEHLQSDTEQSTKSHTKVFSKGNKFYFTFVCAKAMWSQLFSLHDFYFQCPEKKCQAGGSRVHSLTQKSNPLCLHTYLILKAGISEKNIEKSAQVHEIDRECTVDLVTNSVLEHFPSATEDHTDFLKVNKQFLEQLFKMKDISAELTRHCVKKCPTCSGNVVSWSHKTKESFLISLGDIKKVRIPVKQCQKCRVLLYPNIYNVGLIALHNKERIRFIYVYLIIFVYFNNPH